MSSQFFRLLLQIVYIIIFYSLLLKSCICSPYGIINKYFHKFCKYFYKNKEAKFKIKT